MTYKIYCSPATFWHATCNISGNTDRNIVELFSSELLEQIDGSGDNKLRDFKSGKPVHFIIAGLAFTVMFLVTLITAVNLIV